jgi:hypothetical protein
MTLTPLDDAPDRVPERAQDRGRGWLIPAAALVAVMPLIHHGCSCGHDFDFHLLNWMEVARQFGHGHLYPHWAFTPAFNAGEPRFIFYPPLSWVLGALLGLLLTHLPGVAEAAAWSATPILFTWIALTASGLTMYRLARLHAHANAALLAAILYLATPYMLFTAYERTAYAELLAAAWVPLLLHAILRDRITIPRIALPVALLWLTNAPAAVMGCYTLALLAVLRVISTYRTDTSQAARQIALKTFAGTALGLSFAAFYIVPAAYERRYVQITMATITGMRIDHNFLFEHTGGSSDALLHDQVLHTASIIAVLLLAATAVALVAAIILRKPKQTESVFPVLPLAILAAGIAFLLTPLSLPLWNHAPQAVFLQFPWRLLAIVAPVLSLATAAALGRFRPSLLMTVIAAIVLAVALSHPAYHQFRQPCDPEDTAPARLALFHSSAGTDPTDEYTPVNADNDALNPNDPPDWLAAAPNDPPPSAAEPGPAPMHLIFTASRAGNLILNLRNYPSWHIFLNNQPDLVRVHRRDGLIAIPVPAGTFSVDIRYAHAPDQMIGDVISLLGLGLFVLSLRRRNPAADLADGRA